MLNRLLCAQSNILLFSNFKILSTDKKSSFLVLFMPTSFSSKHLTKTKAAAFKSTRSDIHMVLTWRYMSPAWPSVLLWSPSAYNTGLSPVPNSFGPALQSLLWHHSFLNTNLLICERIRLITSQLWSDVFVDSVRNPVLPGVHCNFLIFCRLK